MNKTRILFSFGVIAPLIYAGTVILGAWIRPDYHHATHAISELTAVGAPNKMLLDSLFSLYNILLMGFAFGLFRGFQRFANQHWTGKTGSSLIFVVGLIGLLTNLFFPMDARNEPATVTGIIHLVLAGVLSLGTILSTLFLGLGLIKVPYRKGLGIYSLITCGVIVLSGGIAAAAAANLSPIMGIAQRVTIGAFMQWLFILAIAQLLMLRKIEQL